LTGSATGDCIKLRFNIALDTLYVISRRYFYRSDDLANRIKALKDGAHWSVIHVLKYSRAQLHARNLYKKKKLVQETGLGTSLKFLVQVSSACVTG